MITFLPFESFGASALALDDKRLGKQRIEARQLLDALLGLSDGWAQHPAAKMWRGHEWWLAQYGGVVCLEWQQRGFKDTLRPLFASFVATRQKGPAPWWFGDERLHSSHRANLVRKDPKRYRDFLGFGEQPQEGYWWPDDASQVRR